ncbi:glycosyltransferase family 4 protein [Euzebya sp.]|uniref:glycosyltransferase family 4 protein n=1 Tax=Euzebya sp. TaxID=1971409 RepID=UPI0035112B3C
MRARRLLIVSPTFWPEPVGTPKYAFDAAQWFRDNGWRVAVVTAQPFYPQFELYEGWGPSRRRDEVAGIQILRMPTVVPRGGQPGWRAASEINFAFQTAWRGLQRTVPRPDAILTFSPGTPLVVPAARLWNTQVATTCIVHDIQSGLASTTGMAPEPVARIMQDLERTALSAADRILVLSERMKEELKRIGVVQPIEVVPIWADIPIATDVSAPTDPHGMFTVGYSGNFGRKQGIPLLIDVATELAERNAPVTMALRGHGALREAAERTVAARGLTNIKLEEFVPADELVESLRTVDLHLVPQVSGTGTFAMPSKVVNILASGRPMLAICDEGDPLQTLIKDGIGFWAPIHPTAVAKQILDLSRNRGLAARVAGHGLDYARAHHDRTALLSIVEQSLLRATPHPIP